MYAPLPEGPFAPRVLEYFAQKGGILLFIWRTPVDV